MMLLDWTYPAQTCGNGHMRALVTRSVNDSNKEDNGHHHHHHDTSEDDEKLTLMLTLVLTLEMSLHDDASDMTKGPKPVTVTST